MDAAPKTEDEWITIISHTNSRRITQAGRYLEVKLIVLKKKTQGGQEVKILQEEREFMVINNQRIYRNEGNSSLHNIKL